MSQPENWSVPLVGPVNGTAMATRIDDSFNALMTSHRGAARPSYLTSGKWLKDVSSSVIEEYFYDGTNDILCGTWNLSARTFTPSGVSISGVLLVSNNLNDVDDIEEARANLDVYSKAETVALGGGGTEIVTGGEAWTAPCAVYLDDGNLRGGGADLWYKIDTDATAPVRVGRVRGVAVADCSGAGASATVRTSPGVVSGLSGLTAGQLVYASATPGAMTQTEPAVPASGTQAARVIMGRALSATTMQFEPWHDVVFSYYAASVADGTEVTLSSWVDSGARERSAQAYVAGVGGTQSLADLSSGTPTGDMTAGGGLSAAFNGITTQVASACATNSAPSGGVAYIGIMGLSSTITASGFKVYAPSDNSFQVGNGGGSISATLQGSSDTTTGLDGTWADLGTVAGTDNGVGGGVLSKLSGLSGSPYASLRIKMIGNSGTYAIRVAEVQLYVDSSTREEPVTVGSATIDASATNKVVVAFTGDTTTKFINKTGATRDLIYEIYI